MFPKFGPNLHPVGSPEAMKLSKVDGCSLSRLGQEEDVMETLCWNCVSESAMLQLTRGPRTPKCTHRQGRVGTLPRGLAHMHGAPTTLLPLLMLWASNSLS